MPLKWDRPTHPQLSRTTSSTNRMSGREISLLSPYQSFLQSKRQLGMSDFRRSCSFDKGQNLDFQYTSQFESKYIPCKSSEEQIYDEDLEQPFASGKIKENHVTSEAKGLQNVSFVSVRVSPLYEKEMSVGLPHTYDHEVTILRHQLEQALILAEKALKDADEQAVLRMKAEKVAVWAAEKAGEYATKQLEEAKKREQALRAAERAREIAAIEAEKAEKALAVVELAKQKARTEARRRKAAEAKSLEEAEARKTVTEALQLVRQRYREYDYEELRAATNNFSDVLKLGEGGYGSVYKGKLHHMTVAIKVLEEDGYQGTREFQREVELLSRIHHPHMVLLLGCCPEKGCLVYEYMSNGSLEDRLACRGGNSPLPWYTRIRIMVEVAIALHSLHSSQPEPIVHRDLKPGNILLDRNFVSKLGDVGLARLVPERFSDNNSTYLQETTPVGTFAYIDPEYQRTGTFGPKSDVYALGIVMLQLLTCKPAVGVIDAVEEALACNKLPEVLDYSAGKWPLKETREVAILALHCAQMKRKHRPDVDTLLPTLDRIREFAEGCTIKEACQEPTSKEHTKDIIPARFLCPIVQEVMADPVIVADGYAYDSVATRKWFEEHNTSPLTHISLEHKRLTPNQTLRAVIYECQDKTRGKSAG
ncbi:hypothetical protein O6H91_01G047400 [Diphasiastrum complanatum]|nr:hypothetical protein O6H91_01G047400 [Diphasiastrum complanatum]